MFRSTDGGDGQCCQADYWWQQSLKHDRVKHEWEAGRATLVVHRVDSRDEEKS